ncbi:hypothetical protein [Roseovarius sp. M141]|uniref:hypothetical protein n=1 Tax=Roseovarius sp. M141 TaxID=2583806 RepID=UPI0020CBAAC7|nr:hypothetical protein [Roseovarius sp. M141]MCQ0090958.1 hypothetical protein [Roseovarius sp. M141]
MSSTQITPLSFCVMPSRFAVRDAPFGIEGWDAAAKNAFDDNTLFHDVFQSADPGVVYAVGPPLKRTLRTFIKNAQLQIDGMPATMREISQSKRACLIEISADTPHAHTLTIRHPQLSVNIAISPSALPRYAGLNTMFTLSRNNTLDWVRDWARYHVDTQGVEGIVLYDNASDHYGADALCDVLSGIGGLKTFDVVPAPFQYGPAGMSRELTSARYLQFALLEITRLRFLQQAAGVLNMDIDEMAHGPAGQTVFEAAQNSDAGFLTLPGSWRYPQPGAPLLHESHILRRADMEEPMYPKWCLVPDGPHCGKSWRTHGIKGLPDQPQEGFGFFHCRMVSESWHYDRSEYTDLALEPDPLAMDVLAAALNPV